MRSAFLATLLVIVGFGLCEAAEAKNVSMGLVSRTDVARACNNAGGQYYGTGPSDNSYGCNAGGRSISCSSDGNCMLTVADLLPTTGTSLATVFGFGPSRAVIVPAEQERVSPRTPSVPRIQPVRPLMTSTPIAAFAARPGSSSQ
jgi:hypothetical protein